MVSVAQRHGGVAVDGDEGLLAAHLRLELGSRQRADDDGVDVGRLEQILIVPHAV